MRFCVFFFGNFKKCSKNSILRKKKTLFESSSRNLKLSFFDVEFFFILFPEVHLDLRLLPLKYEKQTVIRFGMIFGYYIFYLVLFLSRWMGNARLISSWEKEKNIFFKQSGELFTVTKNKHDLSNFSTLFVSSQIKNIFLTFYFELVVAGENFLFSV